MRLEKRSILIRFVILAQIFMVLSCAQCTLEAQSNNFVTLPGKLVGNFSLGMTRKDMLKIAPKPQESTSDRLVYKSQKTGNILVAHFQNNKIVQIDFTSKDFYTGDGIHTGNFLDEKYAALFDVQELPGIPVCLKYTLKTGGLTFYSRTADAISRAVGVVHTGQQPLYDMQSITGEAKRQAPIALKQQMNFAKPENNQKVSTISKSNILDNNEVSRFNIVVLSLLIVFLVIAVCVWYFCQDDMVERQQRAVLYHQQEAIVPCPFCGQKNRIADQTGLPCCGICHSPLPPVPPLAFIRYLWQERRLLALYGYWRNRRQYTREHQRYVVAEKEWQRTVQEERRRQQEERRRQEEEWRAREDWIVTHKRLQFDQLDHLTGPEFEQRLAILFRHQGYFVELTKGSGDQGADLLLSNGNVRIAVQAKRYTARVGNGAIQELLGGMVFYNCSRGIVVTTSDFTRSAKELAAKANGVELWERSALRDHFMRAFPYAPPAFSWDAYRRLKAYL